MLDLLSFCIMECHPQRYLGLPKPVLLCLHPDLRQLLDNLWEEVCHSSGVLPTALKIIFDLGLGSARPDRYPMSVRIDHALHLCEDPPCRQSYLRSVFLILSPELDHVSRGEWERGLEAGRIRAVVPDCEIAHARYGEPCDRLRVARCRGRAPPIEVANACEDCVDGTWVSTDKVRVTGLWTSEQTAYDRRRTWHTWKKPYLQSAGQQAVRPSRRKRRTFHTTP